jgi:hypothetical protein
MKKLLVVVTAVAFAVGSLVAFADDKSPAQPADEAKMKADRDAAKAAKAKMTPEEKAAAKKAKRERKHKEMSNIEKTGNPAAGPADAAAMKQNYEATKNDPKTLPSKEAKQKALKEQEKKSSGQ